MCSRSFGQPLTKSADLDEAVAHFTARACEKLRAGDQYAGQVLVFIRTNPFRSELPQYSNSATARLLSPSQDTRLITQQMLELLRPMYRAGYQYAKAGVLLSELVGESGLQTDLFGGVDNSASEDQHSAKLMALMDQINRRTRGTLTTARQAGPKAYAMRQAHLSPAYTTSWRQLPTVT